MRKITPLWWFVIAGTFVYVVIEAFPDFWITPLALVLMFGWNVLVWVNEYPALALVPVLAFVLAVCWLFRAKPKK